MRARVLTLARREGRGPHGAPPDRASVAGMRLPAVAVLGTVVLSIGGLTIGVSATRGPAREPPFDAGPLVGVVAGMPSEIRGPAILLYVDDACPYCAEELARWEAAAGARQPTVLPTIVVSPQSDPRGAAVPPALRSGLVHDRDGSIARALGIRVVPFRALVSASGRVTAVHRGLTAPSVMAALLDSASFPFADRLP